MSERVVYTCSLGVVFLLVLCMLHDSRAADDELDKLGLAHLEIIGTRFIDEHHEIHDYPGDKEDDHDDHSDSSEDSDYHHAIYDHVDISKDDYSDFGDEKKSSYDSSSSEDFHLIHHHDSS